MELFRSSNKVGVGHTYTDAKIDLLLLEGNQVFDNKRIELLNPWMPQETSLHIRGVGFLQCLSNGLIKGYSKTGQKYITVSTVYNVSVYYIIANLLGTSLTFYDIKHVLMPYLKKMFSTMPNIVYEHSDFGISDVTVGDFIPKCLYYTKKGLILGKEGNIYGCRTTDGFYVLDNTHNLQDKDMYSILAYRAGFILSDSICERYNNNDLLDFVGRL